MIRDMNTRVKIGDYEKVLEVRILFTEEKGNASQKERHKCEK